MTRIGVLALQGDFAEHIDIFRRLGVAAREVRHPQELASLDEGADTRMFRASWDSNLMEDNKSRPSLLHHWR